MKDKVLALHAQGKGVMEIARTLNESPHIVARIIKGAK